MEKNPTHDNWDKLEIIIKLFNGVILTILTIVIGYSTQKVADSIRYGELTQKLIEDLALNDSRSKVKRDLSLITLNRTIGNENRLMIADMAEVIYNGDSSTDKEVTIAFTILKERDSSRARKLKDQYQEIRSSKLNSDSSLKNNSISLANADPSDKDPIPKINILTIEKSTQALIGASIVTLFIQTNKNKEKLDTIRTILTKEKFLIPRIEVINKDFKNSVRYFNPQDAKTADDIATKISQHNAKWECPVQQLKNPENRIPLGQIEVWIYQ